jgi:integrase
VPLTQRGAAIIEMRRSSAKGPWVFPAPTRSGHVEKSTFKRAHLKASEMAMVDRFPLYTFRHTCLTRWAAFMDPFTLAYLARHSDFSTTRRYVHPQAQTVRDAIERAREARGPHKSGHNGLAAALASNAAFGVTN